VNVGPPVFVEVLGVGCNPEGDHVVSSSPQELSALTPLEKARWSRIPAMTQTGLVQRACAWIASAILAEPEGGNSTWR
jgi:hypothetical protein